MASLIPLAGCAATTHGSDTPVPAAEPRAELRLQVDLVRAHDCEEAFDLALYESRAVELVAWDKGEGRCVGRTVTIRYFPRRASEQDVIRAATAIAVKVVPASNGDPR